jgi:hypothetical protein
MRQSFDADAPVRSAARLLGAEGKEVTVDLQGYADLIEAMR